MTAESIGKALGGRASNGTWLVRCVAHEDGNPSLALRDERGKVLVHCHAGCSQSAVVDGLKALGLWEAQSNRSFEERIVCAYEYRDEAAELLYQVVRFRDPKEFRPRYLNRGEWVWKKHPRQVLYHLPEVLQSPIVFVVEGEKDVERLRSHGFVATTASGGAKSPWLHTYTEALAGREVILIPDRDEPGRRRVLEIARALLGYAAKITVFEPDDHRAKDISDWFDLGHSEAELIDALEKIEVAQ